MQPQLSIIVAMASNKAIGYHNALPWHIPEDLAHFKALTTGHTIIMGRRTVQSLPHGPLPNRRNIVVSTTLRQLKGCAVYPSLPDAIDSCAFTGRPCPSYQSFTLRTSTGFLPMPTPFSLKLTRRNGRKPPLKSTTASRSRPGIAVQRACRNKAFTLTRYRKNTIDRMRLQPAGCNLLLFCCPTYDASTGEDGKFCR